MGSIFSRRQPKSTIEVLQDIEKELDDLESNQADKEFNRRRLIGYLFIVGGLLFIAFCVYWYLYLFPQSGLTWQYYSILLSLLCIYLLIFWFMKWAVSWWYELSLDIDERKLERLRRRKREILDTVKDKETYKVAKEILERFDPQVKQEKAVKKAREFQQQLSMMRRYASLEGSSLMASPPEHQQLRNRRQPTPQMPSPKPVTKAISQNFPISTTDSDSGTTHPPPPPPQPQPTPGPTATRASVVNVVPATPLNLHMVNTGPIIRAPISSSTPFGQRAQFPFHTSSAQIPANFPTSRMSEQPTLLIPTPVRLPRPVIPPDRSAFDRVIDFLLGEGPANRFALICQHCRSHNGMALKEEIERMAFRCCYCFQFNPARKLPLPPATTASTAGTSDQEDDGTTAGSPSKSGFDLSQTVDDPSAVSNQALSSSRAPSRCSMASHESTQSAPPSFVQTAVGELDDVDEVLEQNDEELPPTSLATGQEVEDVVEVEPDESEYERVEEEDGPTKDQQDSITDAQCNDMEKLTNGRYD